MVSDPSTVEFIVDQQIRQVQNVQALQPINGPQVVGVDGSRTPPQVSTMVSPMDGELPRPSTIGTDFYKKAREIRRDPTIRMVRELSMAPLLMADWEYVAADDAPAGAKELVESIMTQMRLPLLRTSLAGMIDYGWQPYEVIAEQRDDGVSAPRLKPLLQDLTHILVNAADGTYFGLRQTPTVGTRIGWVYLLDQQSLVISQDVEGTNWYGEPTLRSLEKTYDEAEVVNKSSRKYDAKIAGTHWVIYYPLGTSDYGGQTIDNGEIARKLLQQAEAVGGIAVPRSVVATTDALNAAMANSEASQWKIELLSDSGKGQQPFTDRQKYLDVLKVRAFGFPERSILEGQFGTKAEAEAHADIAVSNLEVRHAFVCLQYSLKIVDLILTWNYGPQAKGKVWIKPSPIADDKKAFFRQLYLALIANPQGFMTEMSAVDLAQLRDKLGLPEYAMPAGAADPWGGMADALTGELLMPQDYATQDPAALPGMAMAFDPAQPRDGDGRWADVSGSRSAQTSSPAFKKWFGKSKVVDKDGKPLVVYHGSTKSFKAFGGERSGKTGNPNAQLGHFFTPNPAEASRYASDWGSDGGNVRAVYLSIQNPYEMRYKEFNDIAMAAYKSLTSDPDYDPNKKIKWDDREGAKAAAARTAKHEKIAREKAAERRRELEAEGYDGIVVRMGAGDEYIAFHPKQIKSATGNRGTFDPGDDDITMSLADEIDDAAFRAKKPTDAQREAGNYRKGHVTIHGLRIAIETPRGEKRKKKWPKLPAHYGYFKGSVGADGDQVDVFIGPKPATEVAFVANMKGDDGKFDEHKVMLGFKSIGKAKSCLAEAYDGDVKRIGKLTPMTVPQLKQWLSLPAKVALSFSPDEPRDGRGRWTKDVFHQSTDDDTPYNANQDLPQSERSKAAFVTVPAKYVVATQPRVRAKGDRGDNQLGEDPVLVRVSAKKWYVYDGHNRIAGSLDRGETRIRARWFDYKKDGTLMPHAGAGKEISLAFNPDQPRADAGSRDGGRWKKLEAVGKRFGIPAEAVHDVLSTPADELASRDKYMPPSSGRDEAVGPTLDYPKHRLGTAKIDSSRHATGATDDAYVDYLREFDPNELKTSEHEDGITKSGSFAKYVEWANAGHQAPPISVFGDGVSTNRRRVLAARAAGKKIIGWHGVDNKETGLPLKYGDVKKAAKEAGL